MSPHSIVAPARIVDLPKIPDRRGNLSYIQHGTGIDFHIARAYWIYDVPGGALRHGHAFHRATEFIIAMSGSFDVVITAPDGSEHTFTLNRSYYGLRVEPMTWRRIDNFSTNAVAVVLSSTPYDPTDYIHDFNEYKSLSRQLNQLNLPDGNQLNLPDGKLESNTPLYSGTEIHLTNKNKEDNTDKDIHSLSSVFDCRVIDIPRHIHPNGSLSVIDNADNPVNFFTKRLFYLYDVPADAERGGHSHFKMQELIVAATGSFDVTVTDGHETRRFSLNRPYRALYIPAGIWRSLDNFSSGSTSLVLSSEVYDPEDYVRDYPTFKDLTKEKCVTRS